MVNVTFHGLENCWILARYCFMKLNDKVTLFFQENQFFLSVHVPCLLLAESIDLLVERNGVTGNF